MSKYKQLVETIKKLEEKIELLEGQKNYEPYVGEYFVHKKPNSMIYDDDWFSKFKQSDIIDQLDGNIKILNPDHYSLSIDSIWIKKEDIIWYDDIYDKQRIKIINSHSKKKKK